MKRVIFILLLFSFNGLANEEFRATWVVTWDLINRGTSAEENKALARSILDNHKKANMNAVLWQARQSGTAYYRSSYEPWGYYAGHQDPGYDPLAYAVEEAHKRGLELDAWMNVFEARSTYPGSPSQEHSDWVCRDRSGKPMTSNYALSPGLDAVREYLTNVAMEIVRNYDIDGLHLDYVRWNEFTSSAQSRRYGRMVEEDRYLDGMITDEQIRELHQNPEGRYLYDVEHSHAAGIPDSATGGEFPSWEDWWRWAVTEFVQVLHDSIQAVKPWVRLSVAALGKYNWSGWQGYGVVYQDAALWFNEGYIDQLTPMHYHWTTGKEFYGVLKGSCPQCWEQWIQEGISDGRLYSVGPGSYALADKNKWQNHPQIVQTSRTVPWVDGFQFFRYGTWDYYKYWEEAKRLFFPHKTKIRGSALIDSTFPDPPTLELEKIDSLKYRLTVTLPDTGGVDFWHAIYRSEDETVEADSGQIVEITFGNGLFTVIDSFPGTQDFNGQYRYGAATFNRYWNESPLSNVVVTDSIPSFPPTVVLSEPTQGDTVDVNTPIKISFSKTMDVATLSVAVSLTPAVGIDQVIWSSDHKTVTIQLDQVLDYATDYTLTIGDTAMDINGKAIDGNGDGVGGDPYLLYFRTNEEDVTGPEIIFSYPDYESETDTFDVEDIVTVVFDEMVDPASIHDTTVFLHRGGSIIDKSFLLTTHFNRSVLSLQPFEALQPDQSYSILLTGEIRDLLGNTMGLDKIINFHTLNQGYAEETMIDEFTVSGNWKKPDYSGSTKGIEAGTSFGYSREIYLPASLPKKSAKLTYVWKESAPVYLLREYLAGGDPRNVLFDTSYVLQCHIFGDGSHNKFRFCVDDHAPTPSAPYHEVSPWLTIDWVGWRLVEWDLGSDPVGSWIGNGILEGDLRIDSFQLTHEPGGATRGTIYFDNLRIVRKTPPLSIAEARVELPQAYRLLQNYPNPFNRVTVIPFELPANAKVELVIYDIMGRHVRTLVDRMMSAGYHTVAWTGDTEAGTLAGSGVYIYQLKFGDRDFLTKRMLLLK